MEKGNLNLAQVARGMTPKLDRDEGEMMLKTSVHIRPALNLAGEAIPDALPIIERIATSIKHPGKAIHDADDLARTLDQLEAMPKLAQRWISIASYFASKAPAQELEDWRQEIYLRLMEADIRDTNAAFTYAQRMHLTLWRNLRRHNFYCEPMSTAVTNTLDCDDPYASRTLADIAADMPYLDSEYDYIESRIDAKLLWTSLNAGKRLKAILDKRLRGMALPARDRKYLSRWLYQHRYIALAQS